MDGIKKDRRKEGWMEDMWKRWREEKKYVMLKVFWSHVKGVRSHVKGVLVPCQRFIGPMLKVFWSHVKCV